VLKRASAAANALCDRARATGFRFLANLVDVNFSFAARAERERLSSAT
jgi:hypothetical protein